MFSANQWMVWHKPGVGLYGWARLIVRLRDHEAGRRSYHVNYNINEHRIAGSEAADRLAADHAAFYGELLSRLRSWRPQP